MTKSNLKGFEKYYNSTVKYLKSTKLQLKNKKSIQFVDEELKKLEEQLNKFRSAEPGAILEYKRKYI
jgi:hypothetical protein